VKVGDMIKLKNLHNEWGKVALVTGINVTDIGLGQISVLANGNLRTLPWIKREHYAEVIGEAS
jgi:hypothetical protein